jgi:hypothetical protein
MMKMTGLKKRRRQRFPRAEIVAKRKIRGFSQLSCFAWIEWSKFLGGAFPFVRQLADGNALFDVNFVKFPIPT